MIFFSHNFPTFFNFDFKVKVEKSWGKNQSWKKFICRQLIPIVARSNSLKSWGKSQSYSTLTLTGHRLTLTCSIDTKMSNASTQESRHALTCHRQEQVRGKLKSCPPIPLPSLSLNGGTTLQFPSNFLFLGRWRVTAPWFLSGSIGHFRISWTGQS